MTQEILEADYIIAGAGSADVPLQRALARR